MGGPIGIFMKFFYAYFSCAKILLLLSSIIMVVSNIYLMALKKSQLCLLVGVSPVMCAACVCALRWRISKGKCKPGLWTGLDSWTGLWTEIWTGFWTDMQFNDDHLQHSCIEVIH